ncbi:MAG TPA: hypothetical protein VGM72_07195 [Micropepsaceae bacterium]|jgi:hypothetical protein
MLLNIVNGYVCHNCTDVENAKKGVDPAHPKKDSAPQSPTKTGIAQSNPAVILSGALAKTGAAKPAGSGLTNQAPNAPPLAIPETGDSVNLSI